jgi:hypothetical protein
MMYTLSLILLAFLAALASAQLAELEFYNINDCGADPNNPDLLSTNIKVTDQIQVVDGVKNSQCTFASIVLPGWETNVRLPSPCPELQTVQKAIINHTSRTLASTRRSLTRTLFRMAVRSCSSTVLQQTNRSTRVIAGPSTVVCLVTQSALP